MVEDLVESPRRPRHPLETASAWILGGVFLFTALAKAESPDGVSRSIEHLLGVSKAYVVAAVIGIVLLETALGVTLIFGVARKRALTLSVMLLGAFTLGVFLLVLDPRAPSCGCTGAIELASSDAAANQIALARNGVLMSVGIAGLFSAGRANEGRASV